MGTTGSKNKNEENGTQLEDVTNNSRKNSVEFHSNGMEGSSTGTSLNSSSLQLLHSVINADQLNRSEGLGVLAALPDEVLLHMFSFFHVSDFCYLSCVSKMMFLLINDDLLWKVLYLQGSQNLLKYVSHRKNINQNNTDVLTYLAKRSDGKQIKRKMKGLWKMMCRSNLIFDEDGNTFIVNEDLLGLTPKVIDNIFDSPDRIIRVGGDDGEYHYFNSFGISIYYEDKGHGLISLSILKRIDIEGSGSAYKKVVPSPLRPVQKTKQLTLSRNESTDSTF